MGDIPIVSRVSFESELTRRHSSGHASLNTNALSPKIKRKKNM